MNIIKGSMIALAISSSLLVCGFESYDYSGTICDDSMKREHQFGEGNEAFWQYSLCSYAKAENIAIEEARYRLDIMGSARKMNLNIPSYFGNELSGVFFGVYKGKFGLNVRTSRKGSLTAEDKDLIERVEAESGVPLNIIFDTTHNQTQMANFLATVNDFDFISIVNLPEPINYQVNYDTIEDAIEMTIFIDSNSIKVNKRNDIGFFDRIDIDRYKQLTEAKPSYIKLKKSLEENPFGLSVKVIYSTMPTVD